MVEQEKTRLNKMRSAIQLAGFHYIACIKARPTNADHKLTVGKSTFDFMSIAAADSRELHAEFQGWAATTVLRDLVENFSIFLTAVYQDAISANPQGVHSQTVPQFERLGVEGQMSTMAKDFSVDAAWTSRLVGYNRARNCLAHRGGVVAPKDCTEGDELVVRWLTAKAVVHDGPIVPEIEAVGPMSHLIRGQHVHGKAASFEMLDRERRLKVGSVLRFLPDEVLEICQTFHLAAAAFDGLG